MPLTGPTSLGTSSPASTASSATHNTSATVPSGGEIIICASWGSTAATIRTGTWSGGGLTWTNDVVSDFAGTVSVGWTYMISSAPCPSGLASGTTLTLTLSGSVFGFMISACYIEGAAAGVDGFSTNGQTTGATYTSGSDSPSAPGLAIGGTVIDAAVTLSATGGETELHEISNANAWTHHTTYEAITSAGGTVSIDGQRDSGSGADKTSAMAIYIQADPIYPVINASYADFKIPKLVPTLNV